MKIMKKIIGAVVVIFGVLILLQNMGIISRSFDIWNIFWPLVIILIGIKIILEKDHTRKHEQENKE